MLERKLMVPSGVFYFCYPFLYFLYFLGQKKNNFTVMMKNFVKQNKQLQTKHRCSVE